MVCSLCCTMAIYDFITRLGFNLTELPKWRENKESQGESTSKLLSDIVEFSKKYKVLPESAKNLCKTSFLTLMTAKLVFNVNAGELEAIQTTDETRAVLEYIRKRQLLIAEQQSLEKKIRLVVNLYEALERFNTLYNDVPKHQWPEDEPKNTRVLTVEVIREIHGILLTGLKDEISPGELRKGPAHVKWNNEVYNYPNPEDAEKLFFACVDYHNTRITECCRRITDEVPSVEVFGYLFKCAAQLLFDFVDAHPFGDGNGRMCCLLANYVLSLITPFPVAPYDSGEGRSGRKDYMNAIVECRKNRDKGPGTLAAMLIEGTWRGWKILLEKHDFFTSMINPIGPVAVCKSDDMQLRDEKIPYEQNDEVVPENDVTYK